MKKFIAVLLVLFTLFSLTACGNSYGDTELTYDKKYYYYNHYNSPEEERTYYIFYKDGTGEYHVFDKYYENNGYTKKIKYTIIKGESTLVCVNDETQTSSTTWNTVLIFSDFCLMDLGNNRYFMEDYIKEVAPNFGKVA